MAGGIYFTPVGGGDVSLPDGSITNATLATDAVDANALAADAVAEIGVGTLAQVIAGLNTAVPSSPTVDSLLDIMSKTTGNTFARATDSLEAISDAIASITSGAYMQRSADSAGTLMTGSEQTLYESAPGTVFEFGGGTIIIPASAGAAFTIKVYYKNASGGSYIDITSGNVLAAENSYVQLCPGMHEATNGKRVAMPRFGQYGLKVTLQQGTVGAGYVTVVHEWFDTLG